MSIENWPAMPRRCGCPEQYKGLDCPACRGSGMIPPDAAPLRTRLRDTAAALDALVEAEWMVSHDWGGDRASVMGAAREILARLKQEGLT